VIGALIGRGFIFIAFILALISPAVPSFGFVVAGLLAVAFYLCCRNQRAIWHDGWHAAHDHHKIDGGHEHLTDYTNYIARQQ
jgi:hypothetical protein